MNYPSAMRVLWTTVLIVVIVVAVFVSGIVVAVWQWSS